MNEPLDYRSTGVDLKTYEDTISRLPPLMRRTYTPRVIEWKDGFAGLFRLDDHIGLLSRTYRDPVLVASSDGVGTKLKVAFATGRHSTGTNSFPSDWQPARTIFMRSACR